MQNYDEMIQEKAQIVAQGEMSVDSPPCSLTKYLSATEHEEGQVIYPMNLSPQALHP